MPTDTEAGTEELDFRLAIPAVIEGTLSVLTDDEATAEIAFYGLKYLLSIEFIREYPELARFYDIDVELIWREGGSFHYRFKTLIKLKKKTKEFIEKEIQRSGAIVTASALITAIAAIYPPSPPPLPDYGKIVELAVERLQKDVPQCSLSIENFPPRPPTQEEFDTLFRPPHRYLEAVEESLILMERVKGSHHPDTLSKRYLRTQILHALERHQEALDEIEALLLIMEQIHGSQSLDTLVTHHLHAQILNSLGRHQEALKVVEELLPIMEQLYGPQHSQTLETQDLYKKILEKLKGQE